MAGTIPRRPPSNQPGSVRRNWAFQNVVLAPSALPWLISRLFASRPSTHGCRIGPLRTNTPNLVPSSSSSVVGEQAPASRAGNSITSKLSPRFVLLYPDLVVARKPPKPGLHELVPTQSAFPFALCRSRHSLPPIPDHHGCAALVSLGLRRIPRKYVCVPLIGTGQKSCNYIFFQSRSQKRGAPNIVKFAAASIPLTTTSSCILLHPLPLFFFFFFPSGVFLARSRPHDNK